MNIEYREPTNEDKRRRAGFWLGIGQFITSTFFGYIMLLVVIALTWIVLIVKIVRDVAQ
jgi:hypothetical protein